MHRFLERLDAGASTIVPLLYLAGLMLGTLSYFANVQLGFTLAVGIALSFAAELHSFLALRRCRAVYGQLTRATLGSEQRERLAAQLRVHVAILSALVAFSTFNSVAFVASTWHPTPGWLPAWAQIGIRGAIIPAFFLLAGFLSPLHADAGALLAAASHDMLHRTIKATVRQWKRRVEKARKRGLDLAPIAVALMLDAGDADGARRVRMIADGLAVAEGHPAARDDDSHRVDREPPTDGGTPAAAVVVEHPSLPEPITPEEPSPDADADDEPESLPRRTGTRLVALPRNRAGNRAPKRSQAALQAMAFGLLDNGVVTTRAQLWEALRPVRQDTSNRLFHAWEIARGQQGRTRQARVRRAR